MELLSLGTIENSHFMFFISSFDLCALLFSFSRKRKPFMKCQLPLRLMLWS